MALRDDIAALVAEHGGILTDQAGQRPLPGLFGLQGDDASDLLDAFADRFGCDMAAMRPYLHYDPDEPPSGRMSAIDRAGRPVARIPVTLAMLTRAAEAGRWEMDYPVHSLRRSLSHRLAPTIGAALLLAALVAYAFV